VWHSLRSMDLPCNGAELPAFGPLSGGIPESGDELAEREGFEPSVRFWRTLTFQASAFDHSATAPHALEFRALTGGGGGWQVFAVLQPARRGKVIRNRG
jgi:hypothetical protein